MTTTTQNSTTPPQAPERKTIRMWLEENEPPEGLTSDICPMRSLVALGCTMEGWDPGTAARTLMTREEIEALMRAAKAKHVEILEEQKLEEHQAPILPAKSLLVAFIIKRPTAAQINTINNAVLDGVNAAAAEEGGGLKVMHMTRILNQCTLFPDIKQRQRVFIDYGGLQLEMSNKCIALGNKAVEDIVGK